MKINLDLNLTQVLALWGTIVSTVAVTWNVIRGLNDRKKLKVEGTIGSMLPSEDPNKNYFFVTMTNIGKRPIFVSLCGIIPEQKKGIKGPIRSCILARQLPKMLKEGEYHIEYIEDYSFGGRGIIGIFAKDSTGKEWRANKKNIKMLIKQLNEHRNERL